MTQNTERTLIAKRLIDVMGLVDCPTAEDLKALGTTAPDGRRQTTAGFVVKPQLLIKKNHDLNPDILVYDPFLGTLGLVEVLTEPSIGQLGEFVENAAYLRQLCLLEAERASTAPLSMAECRALTIELVVVFPESAGQWAVEGAGDALRKFARDTGYLRTIAVSLLHEQPGGGFDEKDLRRAFAWLLTDTRKWFTAKSRARQALPSSWTLQLTNYRHHGVRTYELDGKSPFHVFHGYNGSGKSTLTEALELLLSGSIERLEQAEQRHYFPVVRYRSTQLRGVEVATPQPDETAASVVVFEDGQEVARVNVSKTADAAAIDRQRIPTHERFKDPLSAASFRLDQPLMDMLIRGTESKRAELFLRAFFPKDATAFGSLGKASVDARSAVDNLPPGARHLIPGDAQDPGVHVREKLAWTTVPPQRWSTGALKTLEPCLPVSVAQLRLLAAVDSPLRSLVRRFDEEIATVVDLEQELRKLDEQLKQIAPQLADIERDVDQVSRILDEFGSWESGQQVLSDKRLDEAIDWWLELQALADISAKHYTVAAVLTKARAAGWTPKGDDVVRLNGLVPIALQIDELRAARDRLVDKRNDARTEVQRLANPSTHTPEGGAAAPGGPLRGYLSDPEIAVLNRVGAWLPSLASGTTTRAGDVFAAALHGHKSATVGTATIGSPGSFAAAKAELEQLRAACRALLASPLAAAPAFAACRKAFEAFEEVHRLERDVQSSFFSQLTNRAEGGPLLNAALNELLALFKPAPWAYADISLEANRRGAARTSEELRIGTSDNARADLRLNTAEMNSFALALCLLCAPTLDNPLGIVLLDDPLQNMDEMTVAAVARGFGKLVRIYPEGWRILALFHSEEDLLRIEEEVGAAVYRLPWVSPTPVANEKPIQAAHDADFGRRQQTLNDVMHLPESGEISLGSAAG